MKANFDLYFDPEQIALRKEVQRVVKKEFTPELMREIDQDPEHKFPYIICEKLKQLDLSACGIPEEYGGTAMSYRSLFVAYEELAKASPAICFISGLMGPWGSWPIALHGSDLLKDMFLHKIAKGELLFSVAMTEQSGGSDLVNNIQTTAREEGDYYVLEGEKMFITGAHVADYITVLAVTDPDAEQNVERFSLFIVDAKNCDGIDISPIKKIAIKSVGTNILKFNNVKVPKEMMIGDRGKGYFYLLPLMAGHKMLAAADAIGVAEAAYEEAAEYAKKRTAFGRPIGQFQLNQLKLVDMETEIRAAKHLGYHAAYLADKGKSWMMEALVAERFASDIGFKTATNAMSMFGGYGLTEDYNLERYFRDSRQFITTPFTNEIAITQIAAILGFPKSY